MFGTTVVGVGCVLAVLVSGAFDMRIAGAVGVSFGETTSSTPVNLCNVHAPQEETLRLVQAMGSEYKGNAYHLLQRNCNNFADDLCKHLVGKPVPFWVGSRFVCVCVCSHASFW